MARNKAKTDPHIYRRYGLIALGCLLALALVLFLRSRSRFAEGTVISGVDCGALSRGEAAAQLTTALGAREIHLCDQDGEALGTLSFARLLPLVDVRGQLKQFLRQQGKERGLLSAGAPSYTYELSFSLEADELQGLVEEALCGADYVARKPDDARLVLDESGAHVEQGDKGNIPDLPVCAATLSTFLKSEHISGSTPTYELRIENALQQPAITTQDPQLSKRQEKLAAYTDLDLTVEFCGGRRYTLTPGDIVSFLDVDDLQETAYVTVNRDKTAARLDECIEALGADGVEAKYGNIVPTREYVYYKVDDTGYILDRETLYDDVYTAIARRQPGTVTAQYDYCWWLIKNYFWLGNMNTCVEISLDNQYMWFYKDGVLLTETVITTGSVAGLSETNRGAFTVSYRTADTFLNGPTWHYHVDYWIPFDQDIGLHDSDWRTDYGADYYLTDGSHGCVNTPLEPMSIIYDNSYTGMPVVVR